MGRVQDKVVVVTGAANGLGEAIALRLAHDGAKMVLADIDEPGPPPQRQPSQRWRR